MEWLAQHLPVSKFFDLLMETTFKKAKRRLAVVPQKVRWKSGKDGREIGIIVWTDDPTVVERDLSFIPWPTLATELEQHLLPLIFREPAGYKVVVCDFLDKRGHTVQIQSADGTAALYLWFGPDPDNAWSNEAGLVHVGGGTETPIVWQTYRRLSNGAFERIQSRYRDYESTPEQKRRQAIDDLRRDNERTASVGR